ncbi:MAG: hypothetical protein K2G93_02380 [Rikenella sp.]|nr:hypothetical protein [Rikenella sp.]
MIRGLLWTICCLALFGCNGALRLARQAAEGIYCLFDKHSGRTYHRRIFYFRKSTVRRF